MNGSQEEQVDTEGTLHAKEVAHAQGTPDHQPSDCERRVAGAVFDFTGYLTTLPGTTKVGAKHEVSPLLEHLIAWASSRGLALDDALVKGWEQGL